MTDNIVCPICKKEFKELNNSHLKTHNLTEKEFEKLYPNERRISQTTLENRRNCQNPINEQNQKTIFKWDLPNLDLNIDYVLCPICNEPFREINNDHLSKHNLTKTEYDKIYPNNPRTSEKTRNKKYTLKDLTPELSDKLSKSHTIKGYIEKYGDVEGRKKYFEMKKNKSYSHSLDYCIKKYGDVEGRKKYTEINKSRAVSKKKMIAKYGKEEGEKKYNTWRYESKTLENYIKKYGEDEGLKRWIHKNRKISESNGEISKNIYDKYLEYKTVVNYYTNISLSKFGLKNLDKRGRKYKYQLDHKVSICYGFLNKIDPKVIGSIYNLEIISEKENAVKQSDCSMDPNKLLQMVMKDRFYTNLKMEI